jgi:hypothetical protein
MVLEEKRRGKTLTTIGIILISLSVLIYLMVFAVPFLPLTLVQKGLIVPSLIIAGEIAWWAGVVVLGKQLITRYKKYLDPRSWFSGKKAPDQNGQQ